MVKVERQGTAAAHEDLQYRSVGSTTVRFYFWTHITGLELNEMLSTSARERVSVGCWVGGCVGLCVLKHTMTGK